MSVPCRLCRDDELPARVFGGSEVAVYLAGVVEPAPLATRSSPVSPAPPPSRCRSDVGRQLHPRQRVDHRHVRVGDASDIAHKHLVVAGRRRLRDATTQLRDRLSGRRGIEIQLELARRGSSTTSRCRRWCLPVIGIGHGDLQSGSSNTYDRGPKSNGPLGSADVTPAEPDDLAALVEVVGLEG